MQQYHRISVQRDSPFADERLFLWRLMHRGCHHSSDVSPLASSDTSHMKCRHDSQIHKGTDPGLHIRHWQDLRLQHGRQAEYTAPQLPIVHRAAERGRGV